MPQETQSTALIRPQTAVALAENDTGRVSMILVRPGVGAQRYTVPEGTTIQQVLDQANVRLNNQNVMINADEVSLSHVVKNQELVFIVPKPKNAVARMIRRKVR
jgi:hypothetical protein